MISHRYDQTVNQLHAMQTVFVTSNRALRHLGNQLRKMVSAIISYMHSDTQNVINGLQNTAYWIVIKKTLNEAAKGNLKNSSIQYNIYNVQNFRPHLLSSSVARRQLKSTSIASATMSYFNRSVVTLITT